MKALLISTLLSMGDVYGGNSVSSSQEHIWFTGPDAVVECMLTEKAMHIKSPSTVGAMKVSEVTIGKYVTLERTTKCVTFN